jgi:KDO2-lipid IV(A) lauroyltransferase
MNRKKKHHAFSLPLCKLGVVNHFNQKIGYHGVGVYKKLSNKYFDKLIRDIRSKYNTELTPAKRFPISPEIKTRDSFHLWSTSDQSPKANRIFIGIPLWVSKFQCIPALKQRYDLNVILQK